MTEAEYYFISAKELLLQVRDNACDILQEQIGLTVELSLELDPKAAVHAGGQATIAQILSVVNNLIEGYDSLRDDWELYSKQLEENNKR